MKVFRIHANVLLALASVVLGACTAGAPTSTELALAPGLRVWLDQPPSGVGLPLAPFTLKAHARDTSGAGVDHIVFLVNTIALGTVNTDASQPLAYAEFGWNPSVPGQYRIQAQAYNRTGSAGSETALVCMGPDCALAPATPTPLPPTVAAPTTLRPVPQLQQATPTHTATRVLPTATHVPLTATYTTTPPAAKSGCSGTPNIAFLNASPSTISSGGSATLSWGAVTNADSVSVDPGIGGVGTPGSTNVSPGNTTTYTLTARCGNNVTTKQATVTVMGAPPQNTTPPVISGVKPSANPVYYITGCGANTLTVAASVASASGVNSVLLYYRYVPNKGSPSSWNSVTMNPAGGNSYNGTVNVGSQASTPLDGGNGSVEFYIYARDNVGNFDNSSTSSVTIQYCPS